MQTVEAVEAPKIGFQIKKSLPEVQKDDFKAQVEVADPQIVKGLNKHVTYKVIGEDADGHFEQVRRYSDFDALRASLVEKWPAIFIPPIPPKKSSGNLEIAFIEERRRGLDMFMQRLAIQRQLWNSDEVKALIRGQGDVEKQIKNLPKQKFEDLITKYEETFKHLSGKEINTDVIVKISTFQTYLKKINAMLVNFRNIADNMIDIQNKHNDNFNTFFNFMLPEYEKNCMSEYANGATEKYVFAVTEDQKFNEVLSNMKSFIERQEFHKVLDVIRMEEKEVDAWNECFKKREEYEQKKAKANLKLKEVQIELQKIMAGKGGGILNKKPKEQLIEEAQKKVDDAQKENDQVQFICDIFTIVLGHCEIDNFKQYKQDLYYTILKQLANFETEFAKAKIELWECVLNNENVANV